MLSVISPPVFSTVVDSVLSALLQSGNHDQCLFVPANYGSLSVLFNSLVFAVFRWLVLPSTHSASCALLRQISSQFVYRKPEAEGREIRSKYWVRPNAVTTSYVHMAQLRTGFDKVEVDPYHAHVRHYILPRPEELLSVSNCSVETLEAAGLHTEYGFPLVQQERLWNEVKAARRYIDLVAQKAEKGDSE